MPIKTEIFKKNICSHIRLSSMCRDVLKGRRELRVNDEIDGSMLHLRARRVLAEVVVAFPVRRRPDGPRDEPAAAVGADVVQDLFHAVGAEGAFIGADPSVQ